MPLATRPMTLADYLAYDDGTDTRHELVAGVMVAMPPESALNQKIVSFFQGDTPLVSSVLPPLPLPAAQVLQAAC